jgi:predicted short-subunit dehydrogenase-like oxidoreductase (DUF2520 family)
MADRSTIGIIGAGRAAHVLGVALARAGYQIVAVASRTQASAESAVRAISDASQADSHADNGGARACEVLSPQGVADSAELVLITTNDGGIGVVAGEVNWKPGQTVVHVSGALGADVLAPAAAKGARIASWHPFQTLSGSARLDGVTFGIEAAADLYEELAEMAKAVGGEPLAVPAEARALYHAASVMACGYLTTLLREARRVWEAAGLPEEAGRRAIGAVAAATLENARTLGEGATVTGPVSRGDVDTVRLHLEAIDRAAPELIPLYTAISRRSAVLAIEAGRPAGPLDTWDSLYGEFLENSQEEAR